MAVGRVMAPCQGPDATTRKYQIGVQAGLEYATVADLKLSDDGLYYWDGLRWVSTLSADGRSRWTGSAWVPVASPVAPAYPYYQQPRRVRMPTPWTKPMQNSVAALNAIFILYLLGVAYLLSTTMSQIVNQSLVQSAAQNPQASPPPTQLVTAFNSLFAFVFWGGAAIGIVISIVIIIGALNRWTWMFYVVLVLLGLQTIALPFDLITAISQSAISNAYGLHTLELWLTVLMGIPSAALFVWMMIAVFRYGPWAMTRNVEWLGPAAPAPAS